MLQFFFKGVLWAKAKKVCTWWSLSIALPQQFLCDSPSILLVDPLIFTFVQQGDSTVCSAVKLCSSVTKVAVPLEFCPLFIVKGHYGSIIFCPRECCYIVVLHWLCIFSLVNPCWNTSSLIETSFGYWYLLCIVFLMHMLPTLFYFFLNVVLHYLLSMILNFNKKES